MNKIQKAFLKYLFDLQERRDLYRVMLAYARDNIPVLPLIEGRYTRLKKRKDFRYLMYYEVLSKYRAGANIADSFRAWIPPDEYAILSGSIAAGKPVLGLESLVKQASNLLQVSKTFKKGLIGPAILLALTIVVVFGLAAFLVPFIREKVESAVGMTMKYGTFETLVFSASDFIASHTFILLSVLIGGMFFALWSLPYWVSPLRKYVEKIPPWSIYKLYNSTSFVIYIGAMIGSDRPIVGALNSIRQSTTPYMRYYVTKMITALNEGRKTATESLDVGLIHQDTVDLLTDFSKTKSFDVAILSVGDTALEKTLEVAESITKKLSVIIMMTMVLSMGFFLGGIVAMIMTAKNTMI